MSNSTVAVGKVRDAHGLKGELFVVLFAKKADWSEQIKTFQLVRKELVDGKWVEVPYQFEVKRLKAHKMGLIVKAADLDTRTEAEGFRGAIFHIPAELLISKEGERIYLKEIEGFTVLNNDEVVGPIVGFTSNGPQDILQVESPHGEALIPLVAEFVQTLDFKNKCLRMQLPDGLIPNEL